MLLEDFAFKTFLCPCASPVDHHPVSCFYLYYHLSPDLLLDYINNGSIFGTSQWSHYMVRMARNQLLSSWELITGVLFSQILKEKKILLCHGFLPFTVSFYFCWAIYSTGESQICGSKEKSMCECSYLEDTSVGTWHQA